jgi:hypothetical protein
MDISIPSNLTQDVLTADRVDGYWMFVPSHRKDGNKPAPEKALLNYDHAFSTDGQAKRVIVAVVVQPSTFDAYCNTWGNRHIIIKLPERMKRTQYDTKEYTVEEGGTQNWEC